MTLAPPGRDAEGGPPAQGNRLHLITPLSPGREATSIVARGAVSDRQRGVLLDVLLVSSAERDQWERRCLNYWSDGYRAGFQAGEQVGARRAMREWHVTAAGLPLAAIGPSWAELERRRYGPGGRAHFGDPRPGDYPGRQHG